MAEVDPTMGDKEEGKSRLDDIKYYTSLFLGALAINCVFGFPLPCSLCPRPRHLRPHAWLHRGPLPLQGKETNPAVLHVRVIRRSPPMSCGMARLTAAGQVVGRAARQRYSSATRWGSPTPPRGCMRTTPRWMRLRRMSGLTWQGKKSRLDTISMTQVTI